MIYSDFRTKDQGELSIVGDIAEVSAEAVLILRQVYKKLLENNNEQIAKSLLINLVSRAVVIE